MHTHILTNQINTQVYAYPHTHFTFSGYRQVFCFITSYLGTAVDIIFQISPHYSQMTVRHPVCRLVCQAGNSTSDPQVLLFWFLLPYVSPGSLEFVVLPIACENTALKTAGSFSTRMESNLTSQSQAFKPFTLMEAEETTENKTDVLPTTYALHLDFKSIQYLSKLVVEILGGPILKQKRHRLDFRWANTCHLPQKH